MTADTVEAVEGLRRSSYELAQALAPGWERRRAFVEQVSAPVRAWLVRELQPPPDGIVLELAAGAGDTGFEVAETLEAGGRLISTDFSPAMVEVALRRGRERGVDNVDYRVLDAERMDLEDDSVDAVLCRFGYMLMVDRLAALAETRRVLRPGGRLALAVWGSPDRNPFFGTLAKALVEAGHMPPPDPAGPGVYSMASEVGASRLLRDAGFADVHVEHVPVRFAFATVGEYLSIAADTAGPIALVLRGLSDAQAEELASALEDALASFSASAGYELPGVALCAVAH